MEKIITDKKKLLKRTSKNIFIKYFPKTSTKYLYKKVFNRKLNLKQPKTFNEKIMWLKLNTYYKNSIINKCSDKVRVRDYIKEKVGENILVPIIGIYNDETEIEWTKLPNQFVLKINTGSGYNIICKDKRNLDENETKKTLKKWMNEEYYLKYGDYQYKGIKKQILCEKFLSENIRDYKFFCFHGKPKFFYISEGLGEHKNPKMGYYDFEGNDLKIKREGYDMLTKENIKLPYNFNNMIEISKKLSEDFPFVRVDLYNVDGKIYFSELTFIPTGGFMKINPEKYDRIWGDMLKIK